MSISVCGGNWVHGIVSVVFENAKDSEKQRDWMNISKHEVSGVRPL